MFLHLNVSVCNNAVSTKFYLKRDGFSFDVVLLMYFCVDFLVNDVFSAF